MLIGYDHFLAINFLSRTLKALKNGSNHSTDAVHEITSSIDCQDSAGSQDMQLSFLVVRVIYLIEGFLKNDMEEVTRPLNNLFTTKRHFF